MNQTAYMDPKDAFGKWLLDNILERKWSCVLVAEKLHATRQSISNHIAGRTPVHYVWVVAYCRLFNDDPDEIWKLVSKEL